MLSSSRVSTIRICLLVLCAALLSAAVVALSASADAARAPASLRARVTRVARDAHRTNGIESSIEKQSCRSTSSHRDKRHKAKHCTGRKPRRGSTKRGAEKSESGSGGGGAGGGGSGSSGGTGGGGTGGSEGARSEGFRPASPPVETSPGAQTPPVVEAPEEEAGGASEAGSSSGSESGDPISSGESTTDPTTPVSNEEPDPTTQAPSEESLLPAEPSGESAGSLSEPFRFFSSTSFWNEPVPANAPLDPHSAELISYFDSLINAEEEVRGGPWINTTSYSVPVYTVPANQPTVTVTLHDHHANAALSSAWSAVPLPPNAQPAVGTDAELAVWQPSTDRLWEFWRLIHEPDGWYASWGGAMQSVSSDSGVYGPEVCLEASPLWGASASSLSLVGGLISLQDLKRGVINHALSMSIPDVRAGVYASPAQRDDGKSTNPLTLPEGAHLRLNPNLNLAALHLPRLTLMIAEAAQRYGIFVRDGAHDVTFQAQDPTPTGSDPYTGPDGYFEGKYPRELLAYFPWHELQVLKMELHSNG